MLPIVIGIVCGIWFVSGVATFAYGLYQSMSIPNDGVENDVHDGSSLVTGAVIAIMLGPIGIAFLVIDHWRESK